MANTFLSRTPSVASNRRTFTFSFWFKRGNIGGNQTLFSNQVDLFYLNSDILGFDFNGAVNGYYYFGNQVFRDVSAWYHVVLAIDTTDSTGADRLKLYINGERLTPSLTSIPTQNYDTNINNTQIQVIGKRQSNNDRFLDGSLAHFHFTDGTAYDASAFGQTDSTTGIWIPKTAPSVTYGTNGFFLKMENSGAMGTDSSGNSNTWSVGGGTLTQTKDTPSNVFATMNPLESDRQQGGAVTFSNGNLQVATTYVAADYQRYPQAYSSQAVSSGKWYVEMKPISGGAFNLGVFSPEDYPSESTNNPYGGYATTSCIYSYRTDITDGRVRQNDVITSPFPSFGTSDVIGCALDMDNFKVYFHKNGTYINSGDPTSGATGTGAFTLATTGSNGANITLYGFTCGDDAPALNGTMAMNFGNGYFGTTAVSSGNADDAGIGIFEYAPPTGYYALCTKNIASYG